MTPLWTFLIVLACVGLLWGVQLWFTHLCAFRMGFRAAIDFLEHGQPLPPQIVSWRGALRSTTNKEHPQ